MANKRSYKKNKKRDKNIFKKSVKPFFYPAHPCYIYYSPDKQLSAESYISQLTVGEVRKKNGFKLLCDDLVKSVREAEAFSSKQKIQLMFPKSLVNKIPHYSPEANSINLFVLHKISSKIGFAISTYSALKIGTIIAEYVGERKYSAVNLDDTSYVFKNSDGTAIDAKDYGNVARFFHHCPGEHGNKQVMTANLVVLPWPASNTLEKHYFMTIRNIEEFEPLCYDYGNEFGFDQNIELLNAETYLPMAAVHGEL